jgi:hypothetical protein
MQITTIGLDIAKNVFQVHGIDAAEKVVVRKQLRRGQVIAFSGDWRRLDEHRGSSRATQSGARNGFAEPRDRRPIYAIATPAGGRDRTSRI